MKSRNMGDEKFTTELNDLGRMDRRTFVKMAGLSAGVVAFGTSLSRLIPSAAAHDRGAGDVINPPPGAAFKDPVEMGMSTTPGVVEVNLDMKVSQINVNGTTANLMTYNGFFHAPTIRVKRGDTLKVHFKNSLPPTTEQNILGHTRNVTNLHTHGLHTSPSGNADNILLEFKPGDPEFLFEYNTSKQESGALLFYHPHVHGLVSEQMWAGLSGALVVEDDINVLSGFETHIVILKDISLSGSDPAPYTLTDFERGKEGNIVMVNGQVNPVLPIKPGQVQRWRVVNASTARFYRLSLENHTIYLVGTDGGLLDKPYPLSEILLSPGERIDVLVKAVKASGTYRLLSLPYDRGRNTLQTVTLMTISYNGTSVSDTIPSAINPNAARLNIDTSKLQRKRLELSMRNGKGFINGKEFGVDTLTISSKVGTYEVWEIVNRSGMDHPFHQHVNPSQILSIDGGDQNYASLYTSIPAWKDTTIVPRWGRITMLVPVFDFTGRTVFHCHIVEHEDIGMMGIWDLV